MKQTKILPDMEGTNQRRCHLVRYIQVDTKGRLFK